ncbi:hypothetical protein AWC38_SpisGene19065 [Stylophora pistillata]|uniref:Uncharacterized protein n=1 Tax=Stylophora pistillata TaxID=50429 RepID=A0A2B4RJI0_STYPI|nr:hypothetical protein AWC38_SpisGene19065 [Stylophora pistillata]
MATAICARRSTSVIKPRASPSKTECNDKATINIKSNKDVAKNTPPAKQLQRLRIRCLALAGPDPGRILSGTKPASRNEDDFKGFYSL